MRIQFDPAATVVGPEAVLPARSLERVTSVEISLVSLFETASGDDDETESVLVKATPATEDGALLKTTLNDLLAPELSPENEH